MGQYRPAFQVADHGFDSRPEKYADINHQPPRAEMDAAYVAAHDAGLWQFLTKASVYSRFDITAISEIPNGKDPLPTICRSLANMDCSIRLTFS